MAEIKGNELSSFLADSIPDVLLLGNGLNYGYGPSWTQLLGQISTGDLNDKENRQVEKLPFPLQAVILSDDDVDSACKRFSEEFMPRSLSGEHQKLFQLFTSLPTDAILTTNYSYEIEKTICPEFSLKAKVRSKYRHYTEKGKKSEKQLGLYRYMTPEKGKSVWHIHGEAALPDSIVLGHYYYGRMIGVIHGYLSDLIERERRCRKERTEFQPESWIDYFMLGNVYIVGSGLDFSEMDLWWLINCKKINFPDSGRIYYFEPNMKQKSKFGKVRLLETYDVEIVTRSISNDKYCDFYCYASQCIQKIIMKKECSS